MLKRLPFILIFIIVVSGSLYGNDASDSTKSQKRISIGLRCGLYFSGLNAPRNDPSGPPMGYSHYEVEDKGPRAGFSTGLYLDLKGSGNFSIQPEINFMWFSHDTKLVVVRPYNSSIVNYNYNLSYFNMQLCLLPKLTIGKTGVVKLMAGPYLRIPLIIRDDGKITEKTEETLQTCAGIIACLRFDTHVKSTLLGFEIRAGTDLVSAHSFKETSITLGLFYAF